MNKTTRKFATSILAAIMFVGAFSTLLILQTQIASAQSERNNALQDIRQDDRARGDTRTSNEASNDVDFDDESDGNNAIQDTEQDNDCARNSDCSNEGNNEGSFEDADNSNLGQSIDQKNHCRGFASCDNEGTNSDTITEDNDNVQRSIEQSNSCNWWANCEGKGTTSEDTLNIDQSNECAHPGTNCLATGPDSHNICVGGADCTNDGDGKTVIGQAADCNDGPTSVRVCQGPRTLDLDENPLD